MAEIRIDAQKLNGAINRAFDNTVDRMSQAFDDAIAAQIYDWPRPTKRKSGKTVTSPRDIIDTGALLESKAITRSANAAEFSWDVNHAIAVHEGATLRSGTELPARPWTEVALEEVNPVEVFQQELERRL